MFVYYRPAHVHRPDTCRHCGESLTPAPARYTDPDGGLWLVMAASSAFLTVVVCVQFILTAPVGATVIVGSSGLAVTAAFLAMELFRRQQSRAINAVLREGQPDDA